MRSVPVRELHEIELTSVCNLACVYCPHPALQRPKQHMSVGTFARTILHLQHLCDMGTQGEVSLTGIGEATLHPEFRDYTIEIRRVIGDRKLVMSTNGLTMTPDLADFLARWGVNVYVSLHRPEIAGKALAMLRAARCLHGHNHAFVDSSLDWAGQVAWPNSAKRTLCQYLSQAWVAVREDGTINTCCMDAHSKYPMGSVYDSPGTLRTAPTMLCSGCHLIVPKELTEEAVLA